MRRRSPSPNKRICESSSETRGGSIEESRSVADCNPEQEGPPKEDDKPPKDPLPCPSFKWTYVPGGRKFTIPPLNLLDLPLLRQHSGKEETKITPSRHVVVSTSTYESRSDPLPRPKVNKYTNIADIDSTKDVDPQSTNQCDKPAGDGKLHDSLPRPKVNKFTNIADIGSTKDVDQKRTNQCDKRSSKWTYVPGGRKLSLPPLDDYYLPLLHGDYEKKEIPKITLSGPVEENMPEKKCSLEKDDKQYDRSKVRELTSPAYPDSTQDVDQNSTNQCDKPIHKSPLDTASDDFSGDTVLLKKSPAHVSFEVDLCGLNKENIPPKLTDLKPDDSFDYDIFPLMAPVKNLGKPCVLQTPKSLKRKPIIKRMPSFHPRSPANRPCATPVKWDCGKSVVYKGSDGFDRIMVNGMEYIVYHPLGKGGMSVVYCGFNLRLKSFVAIKVVKNFRQNDSMNEVKILESLQHCDKIIKMHDYETKGDKLVIVLEKGGPDFGTILKELTMIQKRLPNYMILFYWLEMLHAVKELHAKGIIHTDLKPANFLRNGAGLKLIDFGIASRVNDDMTFAYKSCQEGTFKYISPEAVMKRKGVDAKQKYKIHFKSDVWSLGCILYQLVYGHTPFYRVKIMSNLISVIADPDHHIDYPEAEWAPRSFVGTIKKCLNFSVKARPSVDELIEEYDEKLLNDL